MALITWSEKYSINIASIDKQHIKLVDLINQLHSAMLNNQTKEVLLKIIKGLVSYTSEHFTYEEELFEKYGYPATAEHKREHTNFVKKISDFQDKYTAGKLTLSMEMLTFLKEWLLKHIAGTDQKYATFFTEKGVN